MKEKSTLLEKIEKFGKGNRVIATVLCVCLIMVSLPVQYIGLSAEASLGTWQKVVSFSELPEEVSRQVVKYGTSLRELKLPDMLTVSCCALGTENQSNVEKKPVKVMTETVAHIAESDMFPREMDVPAQEPEEPSAGTEALILNDEEPVSESDVPVVEPGESVSEPEEPVSGTEGLSSEPENPSPEPEMPSSEPEMPVAEPEMPVSEPEIPSPEPEMPVSESEMPAGGDIGESEGQSESVTETIISGITWECIPEYDSGIEGDYVFRPVLPDTYILAEGVALPQIVVTVEKSEADGNREQVSFANIDRNDEGKDTVHEMDEPKPLAESSTQAAEFYSGEAGQKETISEVVEGTAATSVTIRAPELKKKEGWTPVGWASGTDQFKAVYYAGDIIELTEALTSFYGVYKKDVTLTYNMNGGSGELNPVMRPAYINVNSGISKKPAEFTAVKGIPQATLDFLEWNTEANGKNGTAYKEGAAITSEEDLILYAIYKNKMKTLTADFYSGEAGQKEIISEEVEETAPGITIRAPRLQEIEGWTPMGWASGTSQFEKVDYQAGDAIELTKAATSFYGVYKKDVTLTYNMNGGLFKPGAETLTAYINVNDKVSKKPAEFVAAKGNSQATLDFLEWNTRADGKGEDAYKEGDVISSEEDLTLYAVYSKDNVKMIAAEFYSGEAGQKETVLKEVGRTISNATTKAPMLKEIEGWTPVGWASGAGQFEAVYQAGDAIELTEEVKSFYGVYKKDVTLTYDMNGGIGELKPAILPVYINVGSEIAKKPAEFTAAEGISQAGLALMEWNTKADGIGGISYKVGDTITSEENLTLYAIYENVETKTVSADFYSGGEGQKENISREIYENAAGVPIKTPALKEMEGFTPMGWSMKNNRYNADYKPGDEVMLAEEVSAYYGIYRKPYSLSYDANGGDDVTKIVMDYCYANVHDKVSYQLARFAVEPGIVREGYRFDGWNTRADGKGETFYEGDRIKVTGNATLYAKWAPDKAEYKVEHYKQELDGSYVLEETEKLVAYTGDKVSAEEKTYEGFKENVSYEERVSSGVVEADGGLTLKLYYDRDIYEVGFHLNGADGSAPKVQRLRYGTCLQVVNEPSRKGYTFGGWYLDEAGTAGKVWEYGKTVEENLAKIAADSSQNAGEKNADATGTDGSARSVTLYAKWVDDIAPVLGDASFNQGYKNFLNWIIRQQDLIITVPITEEGSGIKQVNYSIWPDAFSEENAQAADGVEEMLYTEGTGTANNETGTLYIMEGRSSADRVNDVLSDKAYEDGFGMMQIFVEKGQTMAELTIEEDFKGQVILSCMDHAGNVSSEKTIMAEGGMIVEDNAPEISFSSEDGNLKKPFTDSVMVDVAVRDDVNRDGKGNITGGLARVSYRIDSGREKDVSEEEFQEEIVESCEFSVKMSGEGIHTLTVLSSDNAGNENVENIDITIKKKPSAVTPPEESGPENSVPEGSASGGSAPEGNRPGGSEPKTGDSVHVEIYATAAMIAGLTYLLSYFMPEERGMTEEKKAELISRLVRWAENGSRIRKLPAFIGIFFLLLYYHSIGKSVTVEWGEKNAFDNVL